MIFAWVGMCPASPALGFPQAWLMFLPQGGEIMVGEGWGRRGVVLSKGEERKGRLDFPHSLGEETPVRELWFH